MGFFSRLFGGGDSGPVRVDYSNRTDDELQALVQARADLTEVAQKALDEELARRGITMVTAEHAPHELHAGMAAQLEALLVSREGDLSGSPEGDQAWELIREALTLLTERQDYEAVVQRCERAIELARKDPEDEPLIAGTAHQLIAQTWLNREKWEPAQHALEKSIENYQRDGDDSAIEVLQFTGDLAQVLQARGLTEDAERRLRHAIDYGRKVLPGEPILAHVLQELAALLRKRGLETDAATLDQEAQTIQDALTNEAP